MVSDSRILGSSTIKLISVLGLPGFNHCSDRRFMSVHFKFGMFWNSFTPFVAVELAFEHFRFTPPPVALPSPFSAVTRSETRAA
jgi:hypothetical protein